MLRGKLLNKKAYNYVLTSQSPILPLEAQETGCYPSTQEGQSQQGDCHTIWGRITIFYKVVLQEEFILGRAGFLHAYLGLSASHSINQQSLDFGIGMNLRPPVLWFQISCNIKVRRSQQAKSGTVGRTGPQPLKEDRYPRRLSKGYRLIHNLKDLHKARDCEHWKRIWTPTAPEDYIPHFGVSNWKV